MDTKTNIICFYVNMNLLVLNQF